MSIGYHYSEEDFTLKGTTPLQINPVRGSEFLMPSYCTSVEPPTEYTVEQVPAFNEDTQLWHLVESEYKKGLEAQKSEAVSQYGTPLFEDEGGVWVARDPQEIADADLLVSATQTYSQEVSALKELMDLNIITKAAEVTKGTTTESIQAFMSAYQLRAQSPEAYVASGLRVYWPIDEYNLLDTLDTVEKITGYYTKILIYIDKFRELEIANFIAAKDALPTPT